MINPATQHDQDQYAQQRQAFEPFLKQLLGGAQVEGVSRKLASKLMGTLDPSTLSNLNDRGWDVNPNWYQNYIPQGSTLSPQGHNQVMQYSKGFHGLMSEPGADVDWLNQGASQWNDPTYQMGGGSPFQRNMLQDQYTAQRMSANNMVYDGVTGKWIVNPNAQIAALSSTVPGLGLEQSLMALPGIENVSPGLIDAILKLVSGGQGKQALEGVIPGRVGENRHALSDQMNAQKQAAAAQEAMNQVTESLRQLSEQEQAMLRQSLGW